MNSDKTSATVPNAFIEYRMIFVRPMLERWRDNGEIIQRILEALRPWNVRVGGVSIKQAPQNLGERQITFEIIPQRVVFNLFLEAASLFCANVSWDDAPNLRNMIEAIRPVLLEATNSEVASVQATLAFHITPRGKDIREITQKFAPPGETLDESVRAFGFSSYRTSCSRLVDLSLLYSNSLFVRLIRSFDQATSVTDIEHTLRDDQSAVLVLLGLTID